MATQILMPALSPTMEEGKLAKWLVKEGDTVKSGDVIAEIETDKATMEVEAVDEGRLGKILVAEGTEGVRVNAPIALLVGDDEEAGAASAPPAPASKQPASKPEESKAAHNGAGTRAEAPPKEAPPKDGPARKTHHENRANKRVLASPLARRIAREKGLSLETIQGSGPHGRIILRDLEGASPSKVVPMPERAKAAEAPRHAPAPGDVRALFESGTFEEIPHDKMRKAIARRLTASVQTTPHFFLTVDYVIDELLAIRKALNAKSPDRTGPFKLSVNDFIVRAAGLALIRYPNANVTWTDEAMLRHQKADIGVAVAIDGGLVTPIVRDADKKSLVQISREVADLAERARARKLKPTEYEGGSFAISNLGMYGVREFSAIINPPHAAILAVGKGEERAIVRNGQIAKASVMTLTLSCDHRAIDGATGAEFLEILKGFLEEPATMLL